MNDGAAVANQQIPRARNKALEMIELIDQSNDQNNIDQTLIRRLSI
jgi:hypothetical protein